MSSSNQLGGKAPTPPVRVDREATSSAAADDGIFWSSQWEETMEEIMTALKDNRTDVIGLHGMSGVGKSTMIKFVHDQVKKQGLFDEVANIEVKAKPEIRRIQEEIAFALGFKFENESLFIGANLLRGRLLMTDHNQKKKTVLIILDDLWEKLDLEEVGIPLGVNDKVDIKLFLTSRDEYLLSDIMGTRNPISLDVLSNADALKMFKFFMDLGAEDVEADRLTETAAKKCSGLPILIEVTVKALKDRPLDEWEIFLERLDSCDVLEKLKVSYDYLPSKECKKLFLICGIIRGPRIRVMDLLKYTFGLQLNSRKDSSTMVAAAAQLEKFLTDLEAASMLLKSDDNRYVKIHDRLRDLAVKILDEDHPGWAYNVTLNTNNCEVPDALVLKLLLLCCEGDHPIELRDLFLNDMKNLNVLEFTNSQVALSLPSSTTKLDHLWILRTLCLHNCCLDDVAMIGELKGLQILSFRGSDIRKLPIQLKELIVLKMLDLSDCKELTHIEPNVLRSLTKLEELNMENSFKDWEIDQEDDAPSRNARLTELKSMSRLSNIRIHIPSTSMLPKDGKLFSSTLTIYQIMFGVARQRGWERAEDYGCYQKFSDEYNKFSRVLMLTFDSPEILCQDWVQTSLQTAEVLYISGCLDEKCESIGEICINGFECLKHLQIRNCPSFRFIISSNDSYSSNLKSLVLENLEKLEKLCAELPRYEKELNKLRVLKVFYCNKLTHLFDFSLLKCRLSSQLEEIIVKECAGIQCIVVSKGDNNNDNIVTLSSLQKLEFSNLRKFSSFWAGPISNVLFTGTKVAFPCLESLVISGVDELKHIWHPTDYPSTELGKLRLLQVERCDKLVRVINSNVLMSVQLHLESLSIGRCGLMKQVFDVDDAIISTDDEHHLVVFSRLKVFGLYEMKGLEGVYNTNKNMMTMKGGRSMKIFPNIEFLYVSECPHLRYVLCCSSLPTAGVGNLKKIKIVECEEMEAVVLVMLWILVDQETQPAANVAVSYSYSSLKEMMISDCRRLRTFCQYLQLSSDEQEDSAIDDDLRFFSQKEIFPCLESLELSGLSNKLEEIWPHEVPPQSSFSMLKHVEISECAELSVVFPSTLIPRLDNLTDIQVHECKKMKQIIKVVEEKTSKHRHVVQGDGGSEKTGIATTMENMIFTFPRLKILHLRGLNMLDKFYSSTSACRFQFPCLQTLEISYCNGVKTLISGQIRQPSTELVDHDSDMIGALFRYRDDGLAVPNLKSLRLYCLENLTKIWKGEKHQGLFMKLEHLKLLGCSSSCTNLQSLLPIGVASHSCWNVLKKLEVMLCNGFEYLLTPVAATSLVHLTFLHISHCNDMKEVVAAASDEESQGGIIGDHMITFNHLKELRLDNLETLEKFSFVDNMVLNFPSLQILFILNCPNMTTFSSGIATSSTHKFEDLNSFVKENIEAINERYYVGW